MEKGNILNDRNGMMRVPWRLGVIVTIAGSIVAGAFWAGGFTDSVTSMKLEVKKLTNYSQSVGAKVDLLREQQAADDVGDQAVEKRLEQIERVLVRIENLLQMNLRRQRNGDL